MAAMDFTDLFDFDFAAARRVLEEGTLDDLELFFNDEPIIAPPDATTADAEYYSQFGDTDHYTQVPEEVLPLGRIPTGQLLPRGRPLHKYDPELYDIESRMREHPATTHMYTPARATPTTPTPPERAPKRRRLSTASDEATTPAPSQNDQNDLPRPVARITSTAPQHAPQAPVTNNTLPPPPAPANQMAAHPSRHLNHMQAQVNYAALTKDRPPVNVCLPLNVEISINELMTFFPNSGQIPKLTKRFLRNGASTWMLARMQLDPVNQLDEGNAKAVEDKLKWQVKHAGECEYAHKVDASKRSLWTKFAQEDGPHHDLTANQLKLRSEYPGHQDAPAWGHYKLSDIYDAVDGNKWPKGNDRMILTQCLEFAKENPQHDLDTSHWDWIIERINAAPPLFTAGAYATRDHEAVERFQSVYPTKKAQRARS